MKKESLISIKHYEEGVLPRRFALDGKLLKPSDSALLAVTDFSSEQPATVEEDESIDAALADMIRIGIRALLVTRGQRVVGLITSYDIQGEKPLQFLRSSTYEGHHELSVGHIMAPWAQLDAVDWAQLQHSTVGDLLGMLEHAQATHLLVIDASLAGEPPIVRGVVSRTRLLRQMQGLAA